MSDHSPSRIPYHRAPQPQPPRRVVQRPAPPRRRAPARPNHDWYAMRRRRRRRRWVRGLFWLAALALVAAAVLAVLWPTLHQDTAPRTAPEPQSEPVAAATAPETDTRPVVAIDPGHGGVDRGSEGPGFGEYEMTWRTANALADLLEADGRLRPYLTLTEQESQNPDTPRIMPSERAQRAAAEGAALLLSIHGNSDPVYGASGYECYAIPTGRANHDESLRFARLLTAQFSGLGQRLRGVDGVRYIFYDENDEKVLIESNDETVSSDPTFGVLEYASCPAVLSEQCFLTNSADVDLLGDEDGCERAATLYYEAICQWFGLEPNAV